jgi:hypothetical protein
VARDEVDEVVEEVPPTGCPLTIKEELKRLLPKTLK